MRVRLLGPVDVVVDGAARPIQGVRRKAVLAVLALRVGETVGVDRLIEAVWAAEAPSVAVNTVQSHVSYLRGALGCKAAIVARPSGYLLDLGDDGTDVRLAERLIGRAREVADPSGRARYLRDAVGLWRGRALADVSGSGWLDEQGERLDELWLRANHEL